MCVGRNHKVWRHEPEFHRGGEGAGRLEPVKKGEYESLNSLDPTEKPSILMVEYGDGKTTFAATAPRPIIADCETAHYLRLRGMPTALIGKWDDMQEFMQTALTDNYDTVTRSNWRADGEVDHQSRQQIVQRDGNPTIWLILKSTMNVPKTMRDSGKHIVIVGRVQEKDDDGRVIKRPMVATRLSEELVNLAGYRRLHDATINMLKLAAPSA